MNGIVVLALVWVLLAFVGGWVGRTKGRAAEGFVLSLLFGPVGVVAIAGMYPSGSFTARRDAERAEALARVMRAERAPRTGPPPIASVVAESLPAAVPVESDAGSAERSVTVMLNDCSGVGRGPDPLMLVIEPGSVILNACRDDCDATEHELAMTPQQALGLWGKAQQVVSARGSDTITAGPGDEEVVVEWIDDQDAPPGLVIDWTGLYLDDGVSDDEDGPDTECGWIFVTGSASDDAGQLVALLDALHLGAALASGWGAGEIDRPTIEHQLREVGEVVSASV